ncbi:MAG: hypothetical protein IKF01_02590 [Bacilli bacterium]|nr:hypothetical protein [Bacilli bacterium]
MDNNEILNNEEIEVRRSLDGEIYFANPTAEYDYFMKRMDAISKYSNEFFREIAILKLANRYMKALAMLREENSFDSETLADVYYDILNRLGIEQYCIEGEIDNYIKTHDIDFTKKSNMVVSSRRR